MKTALALLFLLGIVGWAVWRNPPKASEDDEVPDTPPDPNRGNAGMWPSGAGPNVGD
ncbi:hypothetical protein [Ostreiculturibacter nitratireducens]|uniref:hypothetical protein n=1 Tax=Ostreiculturibacter nitratireducens TaxID=3075226 RepID=UPI0031B62C6D